jgi:hypothetical protein
VDKDVGKLEEKRLASLGQVVDNSAITPSYQGDTTGPHFYCVNKQVYGKMWTTLWVSTGIRRGKAVKNPGEPGAAVNKVVGKPVERPG